MSSVMQRCYSSLWLVKSNNTCKLALLPLQLIHYENMLDIKKATEAVHCTQNSGFSVSFRGHPMLSPFNLFQSIWRWKIPLGSQHMFSYYPVSKSERSTTQEGGKTGRSQDRSQESWTWKEAGALSHVDPCAQGWHKHITNLSSVVLDMSWAHI